MFCTKCGTQMNGEERFCPNCGTPNSEQVANSYSKKGTKWWQILLMVLGGMFLFVVIVGILSEITAGEKEKFYGTWVAEVDCSDLLNESLSQDDEELAEYITVEDFTMNLVLTFSEDDTYDWEIDEDSVEKSVEKLKSDMADGMTRYFEDMLKDEGIDMSVDEMLESLGVSMDEYLSEMIDTDTIMAAYEDQEGKFDAEKGKLYMSAGLDFQPDYDVYEEYEFNGNSEFAITGNVGVLVTDEYIDLYPLVFVKK